MTDGLPTPRSTLRAGLGVLVRRTACRHRDYADLQRLVDAGRGDTPLIRLRYRCSNCAGGSPLTDWVVTNDYAPQPWQPSRTPKRKGEGVASDRLVFKPRLAPVA
jgi:hypothetical protein